MGESLFAEGWVLCYRYCDALIGGERELLPTVVILDPPYADIGSP